MSLKSEFEETDQLIEKYGELTYGAAIELIEEAEFTEKQKQVLKYILGLLKLEIDFGLDESKSQDQELEKELKQMIKSHKHFQDGIAGKEL